jgi:ribonuclease Z
MSFKLTILGSSGALPAYGRFPSCQFLEIQNQFFLIDCGEGAQMQLMKYQLPYHKIHSIFISHLHGDHYLGLMGLLFSMHLQRRSNDLHLYSHRGLDEIILLQLKFSSSVLNFKLIFHLLEPDSQHVIVDDDVYSVESIPLRHKIPCSGFLFREKKKPRRIDKEKLPPGILLQHIAVLKTGQDVLDDQGNVLYKNEDFTLPPRHSFSYAYCSDTRYHEEIVKQIQGIDLLYHEATFMEEEQDKASETLHSTARQAAMIAKDALVDRLLVGHFSARYRELDPLLQEAQSVFPATELASEGKIIELVD